MIDLTRTIQVLADLRPPLQPVAAPSVPDFSQLPQLAQVFGNNPSQFMADHRVLIQDSHELIQLLAQALPECETTCRFLEHLIQSFIAEVTATLSVVCASSGANWVAVIKQLIVMPNKYIEQAVAHLQGLEQRLAPLTTRLEQISETKSELAAPHTVTDATTDAAKIHSVAARVAIPLDETSGTTKPTGTTTSTHHASSDQVERGQRAVAAAKPLLALPMCGVAPQPPVLTVPVSPNGPGGRPASSCPAWRKTKTLGAKFPPTSSSPATYWYGMGM